MCLHTEFNRSGERSPVTEPNLPQRLRQLVDQIQQLEPTERARARALVQTVLDFHGAALAQLLELLRQEEDGRALLEKISQDSLVRNLLLLHGLHPADLETRTREALTRVQPFLRSQGAEVELIAVADEAVRLCLRQNASGYPVSLGTLRAAIEEAIAVAAPDARLVEFVEPGAAGYARTSRVPLPLLARS
jgi:Fe-S cluster biogenesis protein NfuA